MFGVYGMDLPLWLEKPNLWALDEKDTIPSNIDPSTISLLREFLLAPPVIFSPNLCTTVGSLDDGKAVSLYSSSSSDDVAFRSTESGPGQDYQWTTIETVLIRLVIDFEPWGTFPVLSKGTPGWEMGYDAAVCVQKYEPWIIEAYNVSFASPSILRIVEKWNGSTSSPSGRIRGTPIASTRYLNKPAKEELFHIAHGHGVSQMMKINYEDYVPGPIVGPVVLRVRHFF